MLVVAGLAIFIGTLLLVPELLGALSRRRWRRRRM